MDPETALATMLEALLVCARQLRQTNPLAAETILALERRSGSQERSELVTATRDALDGKGDLVDAASVLADSPAEAWARKVLDAGEPGFHLAIDSDTALYALEPGTELARILRQLARTLDGTAPDPLATGTVRDLNGNSCGTWTFRMGPRP